MSTQEDNNKVNVGLKDNSSFYLGVLRFSLGILLVTVYHLFDFYVNYDYQDYPFRYVLEDMFIQSIPKGLIVGIILVNYKKFLVFLKKILDFKIVK